MLESKLTVIEDDVQIQYCNKLYAKKKMRINLGYIFITAY